MDTQVSYYHLDDNSKRAYLAINQDRASSHMPGIVFLAGHGSDMMGSKAEALCTLAEEENIPFLRFDYFGHGQSDGQLLDGNLSVWLRDCTAMIDNLTSGPQILVGSSLGGWLMVLTALARKDRVAGLVGIAAAPDFTKDLIWDTLSAAQKEQMKQTGSIALPNPYADDDVIYPLHLIEDGNKHLVLGSTINLDIPVILHQGLKDEEVPWQTALRLSQQLAANDVQIILHKDTGHRFSEPGDIDQLQNSVRRLHARLRHR